MVSLIIDTATKVLYIAIVRSGEILYEKQDNGLSKHGSHALAYVNDALSEVGLSPFEVNEIIVGAGPGSYTGVRIAGTIGKVFSLLNNCDLKTISSLYLMSSGYDHDNVCAMVDAKRGNFFCACYGEKRVEEKLRSKLEIDCLLEGFSVYFVNEDNFKVNPFKVIEHSSLTDKMSFSPSYLRITEAEYNLAGKKND